MLKIDLCFSGWVRGFKPNYLTVVATGKMIPIDDAWTQAELQAKLDSGEFAISLVDALNTTIDTEIEITDVEVKPIPLD